MMDFIFGKFLMWVCIAGLALMLILFPFAVYQEVVAEKFSLRKDQWTCTEERSHLVLVGKLMVPQAECINWKRT